MAALSFLLRGSRRDALRFASRLTGRKRVAAIDW
jgi:hypothetical protein